jgi:glycosyltransferase involved in cell wall biosynthesis
VLFVGRKNDPIKGFEVLEEAMKLVIREVPNIELLVAGGSVSPDEVVKMYGRADLFVLPSLSEGFPLTLFEAWAAKLAVVATAVGEVPNIVDDGVNGYLVPPGEAGSLAQAIITALKNPDLAKMGENGYNLAKEYTWERVASQTQGVYQKIC